MSKNCIKNTYAFYAEHLPGIIPVDPEGRSLYHGPDTIHIIYIETSEVEIQWTHAWINEKTYSVAFIPVKQFPVEVGVVKNDSHKIFISPAGKNKLWQLELSNAEKKLAPPIKIKRNEIK